MISEVNFWKEREVKRQAKRVANENKKIMCPYKKELHGLLNRETIIRDITRKMRGKWFG